MGVTPKVGVGACRVVRTAVGQCECVPVHCRRDVGLGSSVGKISVPFLVAGAVVMHLKQRRIMAVCPVHDSVFNPFNGLGPFYMMHLNKPDLA